MRKSERHPGNAGLTNLPAEQKLDLVERLRATGIAEISAAASDKAKKVKIEKIHAMRESRDPAFVLLQGALGRCGIAVEDATSTMELDKLFAAAGTRAPEKTRWEIKTLLFRLGLSEA